MVQIKLFYNGLNGQTRTIVDAATSGMLLSKTTKEAHRLLKEMSANNCQWLREHLVAKKAIGIHEVDPIMSLLTQVLALANQIASFTTRDVACKESAIVVNSSSYGGDDVGLDTEQCQFINNRNYNFRSNNNLLTRFHPGLRNHENFSYDNPRNSLQPPLGHPQPLGEKSLPMKRC